MAFGFWEAILSHLTRQIGLRTDAADMAGSLHAKATLLTSQQHLFFPWYAFLWTSRGNVTISTNQTSDSPVLVYDNLTVNSGVTFTISQSYGLPIVVVKNTLTLTGTIAVATVGNGGTPNSYGGAGGAGGGGLVLFAKNIINNGIITANGAAGITASSNVGDGGSNGSTGGSGVLGSLTIGGGGGGGSGGLAFPNGGVGGYSSVRQSVIYNLFSMLQNLPLAYAGGGGGGSSNNNTGYAAPSGGGGGGGIGNSGGGGGSGGPVGNTGSSGGGGGGGGLIIVCSPNAIPSVTIQAIGGNGGAGYGYGGGGGGGGGGAVIQIAPSSSASVTTTGGSGGSGGSGGTAGSAGSNGISLLMPVSLNLF